MTSFFSPPEFCGSRAVQGDHSTYTKPPVNFKTKVLLWPGLARQKPNFCFEVNRRFWTSWMVTLCLLLFLGDIFSVEEVTIWPIDLMEANLRQFESTWTIWDISSHQCQTSLYLTDWVWNTFLKFLFGKTITSWPWIDTLHLSGMNRFIWIITLILDTTQH